VRRAWLGLVLLLLIQTPGVTEQSMATPQVLLSRQLMEQTGVKVGDMVTLAADASGTRATSFRVAGMYEPTPDPMRFSARRLEARLHLPDLIAVSTASDDPAALEEVSTLNVALVSPGDAAAVQSALARRTFGLFARSTTRGDDGRDPFVVLERFHWAIAVVSILGSTAFLLALMVMRAEERREIVGILRLMGIPARSILGEVVVEGLLIAIGGAVFGILVAVSAEGLVNRFFQWRYDTTLVFIRVTAPIAWRSIAFAVPLGVIAGVVASWTLLGRDVASLVRR
jgi:ABC-type lipoprotein release transport system permease subunit